MYDTLQIKCLEIRSKSKKVKISNVSHKKGWSRGEVQMHLEPHRILLIKINNDVKLDKGCVKNKLCRNNMSKKSYIYEYKMVLFGKGET